MTRKEQKYRAACMEACDRRLLDHLRKSAEIVDGWIAIKEVLRDPNSDLAMLAKAMKDSGLHARGKRSGIGLPDNVITLNPRQPELDGGKPAA